MTRHPHLLTKLALLCFVLLLGYSCNKDSDLLAEYVVNDTDSLAPNDVVVTLLNSPIVIDPLSKASIKDPKSILITHVTPPKMGTAIVNSDNTITYTPDENKSGTDAFDYSATVTKPDKTVSTETGNITVNVAEADKTPTPTEANLYYVTTTGKSSNSGTTEEDAWSIQHAFSTAQAGDIIYIKAGNYGALTLSASNSGTADKPIKFIGYTTNPKDLVSNEGSSFKYGDKIDSSKMPLIKGKSFLTGTGLDLRQSHIVIENLQISDYLIGVNTRGKHTVLKNVIVANNGEQRNNSVQGGRGFHIYGDYTTIKNSFSLNSNGEGINIKGANHCIISHTQVYSVNKANPGGYYIAITHGGSNNIIDNCTVYRDKDANLHQGHGYVLKDMATNNIIRNSKAYNTGIEVNFSGVHSNTFENINIYGNFSTNKLQFSSCIRIINGAHDNVFKDIYIEDTRYAFNFHDFNDGYVGPDGDRDELAGGHNNKFINIEVNKGQNIIGATSPVVGTKATSKNNTFVDCTFRNITGSPIFSYMNMTNTTFTDCIFENIPNTSLIVSYKGGIFTANFESPTFKNVNFPDPTK